MKSIVFLFFGLWITLFQNNFFSREPREYFVDSLHIGKPGFNKVELKLFGEADESSIEIKFFSKNKKQWILKNTFVLDGAYLPICEPRIEDLNNDKKGDLIFKSAVAARGANEINTLYVYDAKKEALVLIKNSDQYPNLIYDSKFNCLVSTSYYGGETTSFLKIHSDSLQLFKSIAEYDGEEIISVYDKKGKETVIRRKPVPNIN